MKIRIVAPASLFALTALVACGTQSSDSASVDGSRAAATQAEEAAVDGPVDLEPAPAVVEEGEEQLAEDYAVWAGTTVDLQAAAVVVAYSNNADQIGCLRANGVNFKQFETAIAPVDPRTYYQGNLVATPAERLFSYDETVNWESDQLEQVRAEDPPAAAEQVLDDCSAQIDSSGPLLSGMSEEDVWALAYPAAVEELNGLWASAVSSTTAEHASAREAAKCLRDEAPPRVDGGIGEWEAEVEETLELGSESGSNSEQWRSGLAEERQLMTAVSNCNEDTYDDVVADLTEVSEEFKVQHRALIAQAQENWRNIRALAIADGMERVRAPGRYRRT